MFSTVSLREEKLRQRFIPDVVLAIIWNWVHFNSTYKYDEKTKKMKQAMNNLVATRNDASSFKKTVSSFGVNLNDSGTDGVYIREDPKSADHCKLIGDLKERLTNNPEQKICILWMLAGHGVIYEARQCLLHNEYKEASGYYVPFKAEYWIRELAGQFKNSCHIVFFAACR